MTSCTSAGLDIDQKSGGIFRHAFETEAGRVRQPRAGLEIDFDAVTPNKFSQCLHEEVTQFLEIVIRGHDEVGGLTEANSHRHVFRSGSSAKLLASTVKKGRLRWRPKFVVNCADARPIELKNYTINY